MIMRLLPRVFSSSYFRAAAGASLVAVVACSSQSKLLLDDPEAVDPANPSDPLVGVKQDGDVGNVTVHRLNSAEYDNTVRDLLGDTTRPSTAFPPEYGADSFTNNADELTISPILFERYEAAAEKLAAAAVANNAIMTCDGTEGFEVCAAKILGAFLPKAWRRPVTQAEIAQLVALVKVAQTEGDAFNQGMQLAFKASLLSPHFLFRVELDPDPASSAPHRLSEHELASRLSYLLWSSMPDEALRAAADAGTLTRDYDQHIERMFADGKAKALLDNFAMQWLNGILGEAKPSATVFPAFNTSLRTSMAGETRAFLESFLFSDASMLDMLDANYTYLNAELAGFYGISGVTGTGFTRVTLDPTSNRGGILRQASVLTMTSISTRTSPVRRGEWVMVKFLCQHPPPPPPDVPALPPTITEGTMRERMAEHRKNPVCATCHKLMDPIGLAFEHFDGIGRYRSTDNGLPIDAAGQINTTSFDGAGSLATLLKGDERVASCMTKKVFSYALGRSPRDYDSDRLSGLTADFAKGGYRMKTILNAVTHNGAFLLRRGGN